MNFLLNEQHQQFAKEVQQFAKQHIIPFIPRMEKDEFPKGILEQMATKGWLGITLPKQYGGLEMDFISYILAIKEISKVSATVGVILSVHTSVGTNPIFYLGTDEQKERFVKPLASGNYLGAFCLTEAQAGSDAFNLKTTATKVEDGFILNGSKMFITNGEIADTYIVFAKTNEKEISAFIVEKNTPGFIFGKNERKMGLHGSKTVQLFFENMKIPKENLLGEIGQGFKIAMSQLDTGRIGIAAQSLGIAEAVVERVKEILRGQSLSQSQLFAIANMETSVEAAKLLVFQAAYKKQNGLSCSKEASMAKLFASKTAVINSQLAIDLVGLEAIKEEEPLSRYFRDTKITQIYEGTSEVQKMVILKNI